MTAKRFWAELKSSEFAPLDPNTTLAILPVAATELPDDLHVLFLPIQTIGKSNEHLRSPGTITHSADTLMRGWCEIGESVHRAACASLSS